MSSVLPVVVPVSLRVVSAADVPPSCSKVVAVLDTVSAADPLSTDGPDAFGPLNNDGPALSSGGPCATVPLSFGILGDVGPLNAAVLDATVPLSVDVPGAAVPWCLGVERPSLSEHSVRCRLDHNV